MVVTTTGAYLDRILANTAKELDRRKALRSLADVRREADAMPAAIPFAAALRGSGVSVIAEVKRASPSKGAIAPDSIASDVAREYLDGGAAGISVLTDERFFRGTIEDLETVAGLAHAAGVPVLRKDFVIDEYQIVEARAAGADAVLLIVAALERGALSDLLAVAREEGVDALVEVHDEMEFAAAIELGARLIGINNRDLRTFAVDLATTERLAERVPPGVTLVGESGIRTRADVERLGKAGVHAVLVGETLMVAVDRAAAVRELLG